MSSWSLAGIGAFFLAPGVLSLLAAVRPAAARARRLGGILTAIGLAMFIVGSVGALVESGGVTSDQKLTTLAPCGVIGLCLVALQGGLARLRRAAPDFDKAASAAFTVFISLTACWFAVVCGVAAVAGVRVLENKPAIAAGRPGSPPVYTFTDLNFEVRPPDGRWVRRPASNPTAIMLSQPSTDRHLVVIAEKLGDEEGLTAEYLLNLAQAGVVHLASEFQPDATVPRSVAGIDGLMFNAVWRKENGPRMTRVHWVGHHHGFVYQLVLWGAARDAANVQREADQLLERFRLVDPEARAELPAGQAATIGIPGYGLSISLPRTGWTSWTEAERKKLSPIATIGAKNGAMGAMLALPVSVKGLDLSREDLRRNLLSLMTFEYPSRQIRFLGEREEDGVEIADFAADRAAEGGLMFHYRLRTLKRGDVACLVAAWRSLRSPSPEQHLQAVLDGARLEQPAGEVQEQEHPRQAVFLNGVGTMHYQRGQYPAAAERFRAAAELSPEDPAVAANLISALLEMDKLAEALAFLGPRVDNLSADPDIPLLHASLLSRSGAAEEAVGAYRRVFDKGFGNDEALGTFIGDLLKLERPEQAEQDLERYKGLAPGSERVFLARIRRHQQRDEDALAVLEGGLRAQPVDLAAGEEYLVLADELGRHSEVLEAVDRLEAAGHKTDFTLHAKGVALDHLGRLPAAKAAFEESLKLDPQSEETRSWLRSVSSRLGQSDTSAFREPIEAVVIPEEAFRGAVSAPPQGGAVLERRAAAFKFVPGQVFRRTDSYRGRIVDRRGIDATGSFAFEFDPRYERIFVNKIEVRDESGRVVYSGGADACYTSEDGSSRYATEKRTLHVPIAALAPRTIFDVVVTREDRDPPQEMPFENIFIVSYAPIERGVVAIEAPASSFRHRAPAGVEELDIGGMKIFRVDGVAPWRSESLLPPEDAFLPFVTFGGGEHSWDDVGREYLERIAPRLEASEHVAGLAAELTAGLTDREARIRAIAAHVQSGYSYRAIAFGPRAQIPPPIGETLVNRYGDCKDHALLAPLLFRVAGIESNLALTRVDAGFWPDLPAQSQFDHMIVYLPVERRFLDLTDKETDPLLPVPVGLSGQSALVLDPEHSFIAVIPPYPPEGAVVETAREVLMDGHDLAVRETVTLTGVSPRWLREFVRGAEGDELVGQLDPVFSAQGLQLEEAHAEHADDTGRPLVLRVAYRSPAAVIDAGGGVALSLPYVWERRFFRMEPSKDRAAPAEVRLEEVYRSTVRLTPGPGLSLPDPESLKTAVDSALAAARREARVQDGTLVISTEMRTKPGRTDAAGYNASANLTLEALRAAEHGVVLPRRASDR